MSMRATRMTRAMTTLKAGGCFWLRTLLCGEVRSRRARRLAVVVQEHGHSSLVVYSHSLSLDQVQVRVQARGESSRAIDKSRPPAHAFAPLPLVASHLVHRPPSERVRALAPWCWGEGASPLSRIKRTALSSPRGPPSTRRCFFAAPTTTHCNGGRLVRPALLS